MNPNLNSLRIALLQCLSSPDISAEQVTDVVRETIKTKMDEATETTKKSRTILEKLRMPHHYSTCPDYLTFSSSESPDTISFSSSDFTHGAAQPVMNFDGIYGAYGEDTITLG